MRAEFKVSTGGDPHFVIYADNDQERQLLTLFIRQSKYHIRCGGSTYSGDSRAYVSMQVLIDKVARDNAEAKRGQGNEGT